MKDNDDISLKEQATKSHKAFEKAFKRAIFGLLAICIVLSLIGFPWKAAVVLFVAGCLIFGYSFHFVESGDQDDIVDVICSNINRPPADLGYCSTFIRNELARKLLTLLVVTYGICIVAGALIFGIVLL